MTVREVMKKLIEENVPLDYPVTMEGHDLVGTVNLAGFRVDHEAREIVLVPSSF